MHPCRHHPRIGGDDDILRGSDDIARGKDGILCGDGDCYRRAGNGWLIQERRYHKLYKVPADLREQHRPCPG